MTKLLKNDNVKAHIYGNRLMATSCFPMNFKTVCSNYFIFLYFFSEKFRLPSLFLYFYEKLWNNKFKFSLLILIYRENFWNSLKPKALKLYQLQSLTKFLFSTRAKISKEHLHYKFFEKFVFKFTIPLKEKKHFPTKSHKF